jgi:hypothetical protein
MPESPPSVGDPRHWKAGARFILILVLAGFGLFGLVQLAEADTARERWSAAGHVAFPFAMVAIFLPTVFDLSRFARIVLMILAWIGIAIGGLGILWG